MSKLPPTPGRFRGPVRGCAAAQGTGGLRRGSAASVGAGGSGPGLRGVCCGAGVCGAAAIWIPFTWKGEKVCPGHFLPFLR